MVLEKKKQLKELKKSNDYPKIKDEHDAISNELKELKRQRDDFIADNKTLLYKNQKNEWLRLAITLTLDTIKDDPEKDILIYNILYPSENPNSGYFPLAYEEKIAKIVENLHNIILEINTNNMLN